MTSGVLPLQAHGQRLFLLFRDQPEPGFVLSFRFWVRYPNELRMPVLARDGFVPNIQVSFLIFQWRLTCKEDFSCAIW